MNEHRKRKGRREGREEKGREGIVRLREREVVLPLHMKAGQ